MSTAAKNDRAVVAFVPVIHKGYVDFFASQPGDIWIFGDELIKEFVHLTRDLRVMKQQDTIQAGASSDLS